MSPSNTGRRPSQSASSAKGRQTTSAKGRTTSSAKGRTTAKPAPKRRFPIFLIIGVIAAVALAVVIVLSMGTGGTGPVEAGTPVVTGDSLVRFVAQTDDPAVGQPIPEVQGADFDGTPVVISHDGRAKMILFIAHWCSVCRQEVPMIAAWLPQATLPDSVDLYTVSTGIDPNQTNYPPSKWLADEGWTLPVVMDDEAGTVANAFGLSAYPYFVFVKADGNVAARMTGLLPTETLSNLISGLAEG